MSTYYYFACDACKEYGGFFSRQAWGWGNFDIIDSFAFLANHADHPDPYQEGTHLRVISEHEAYDLQRAGWKQLVSQEAADEVGVLENERVADYDLKTFPHSEDWHRVAERFARDEGTP